ncbi:MAG: hypothetical protein HY720_07760 [Planctomycetes bacterium]|nr:hypothetical protein [Planctomycetota bacterium]
MTRPLSAGLSLALLLAAGCAEPGPEVRITMVDEQVLVGRLTTRTITLDTGLGELGFDSEHAGELGPLEGPGVDASGHLVKLWLRNGSEFTGEWQKPEVEVYLEVGGEEYSIDVPIVKLARLQFRGEEIWPEESVFRIKTKDGDDFFVDVTRTRLEFESDLGTFRPYLEEIEKLDPLDDQKKKWRVTLSTGTSLVSVLKQDELDLALAMGPEKLVVPLASIVSMERQWFGPVYTEQSLASRSGPMDAQTGEEAQFLRLDSLPGAGLFYSNRGQKAAKMAAPRE